MTKKTGISLIKFVRAMNNISKETILDEKRVIEDVSLVVVIRTMGDWEKRVNLKEGEITSVEKIFDYCKSKEERLQLISLLFDNLNLIKDDYIINQVAALPRSNREELYDRLPTLRDFMSHPIAI